MQTSEPYIQRASGLLRTLVVASATLAILLVCFTMYQFSQLEQEPPSRPKPRLPAPRTEAALRESSVSEGPSVSDGSIIGPGRDIKLTIYSREGLQARLEIEVHDWTPRPGAPNEFILIEPIARMRTRDGNAVRITARRGILEARRHGGGSIDPQRGRLTGGVLIEFDRLTEKQRAALPEELRQPPDPSQIIRVETEEIEFDLEYSKLIMPQEIRLIASDIEFVANDLEIRFSDDENRVESLRTSRGGSITLRGFGDSLGLSIPGMEPQQAQRFTLTGWLHDTLQAALDAHLKPPAEEITSSTQQDQTPPLQEPPMVAGIPVFRPSEDESLRSKPEIRYFARFEGDVRASRQSGGLTGARLEADLLEIVREFSDRDKDQVRTTSPSQNSDPSKTSTSASPPAEEIVLTWTKRLVLEALSPEDQRWNKDQRATITAIGQPVRLSHPDGNIECAKLTYHPDSDEVWLYSSEENPAIVRSVDQGKMTGTTLSMKRRGDEFSIVIEGPGALQPAGRVLGVGSSTSQNASPEPVSSLFSSPGETWISFQDRFEAKGRMVTKTTLNFTGGLTSRRFRILDSAVLTGRAVIRQEDTEIESDVITLSFGTRHTNRDIRQTIEQLQGEGNVIMTQGRDRLSCDAIDVHLTTTQDGRIQPTTATAKGNVEVVQEQRTIKAGDKLIVDFTLIPRNSSDHEVQKSEIAEKSVSGENRHEPSANHEARTNSYSMRVGIKRIRAFQNVSIVDLNQDLEVSADSLDCTLNNGNEIESALVLGNDDHPASVRLNAFTVTGKEIKFNVPDQWADVPGQGRMTFRSRKDLNGRRLSEPIPISISWGTWMKYRGRENRAIFDGRVHATSRTTTTFDCSRLVVEFDDVEEKVSDTREISPKNWLDSMPIVKLITPFRPHRKPQWTSRRFSKEPAFILATGNAVVLTSEMDPATGQLKSRARITGPKLSVNLRPEVSKMLIEGEGSLQLEDFRPPDSSHTQTTSPQNIGDLFDFDQNSGPSKTLITWKDSMWYDFSIDQTRFEGRVELKHFSGQALQRLFGGNQSDPTTSQRGRSTFLTSDILTVDFLDRRQRARQKANRRMGRISTNALRQFQASGHVILQDQSEGLSLWADRIIYERPRSLLAVYGTDDRKARIVKRVPNKMPYQLSAKHLFYNLATGEIEVLGPKAWGQ